jgi:small neutral amino acid transporter SnatA (MarC family)
MASELLSAAVVLALVIDPLGNVPIVNAMLAGLPTAPPSGDRARMRHRVRHAGALHGVRRRFLDLMHLSETSVSIAGVSFS